MTAPSIISDQEAREIAASIGGAEGSPIQRLAATGEILEGFAGLARNRSLLKPGAYPSLIPAAIWAYVAHHGERGPQPNWTDGGSQ